MGTESDRTVIARNLRRNNQVASAKTLPHQSSSKASLGRFLSDAIMQSTIDVGQTSYSAQTEEEFEQDVATQAAHRLASNPVLCADKSIRTELGGRISLHDQVKYRGDGPVRGMSYKEQGGVLSSKEYQKDVGEGRTSWQIVF